MVRIDTVEGGLMVTVSGPRCTREVLWAGETERGVGAVEGKLELVGRASAGTSKFRELEGFLDENGEQNFCFNCFINDCSSSLAIVMKT